MTIVLVLQHVHESEDGSEKVKMIGVYASDADARAAIARLRDKEGFRLFPEGFHVDPYEIGKDHWTEGYITAQSDGTFTG
jgi:hypothetical protein